MRVVELWRYPLKSAQGERLEASAVTDLGLAWDRSLALVDVATGRALTARREPQLLMLSATVVDGQVRLSTPAGHALASDDEVSDWLGHPVRVARPPADQPAEYDYPLDNFDESGPWSTWTGPAGVWHDSNRTRVSILSTASLRDWPTRRFRPNVVVDGAGEDDLVGRRIRIGSTVLDVVKRIDRCVMVTRPQPGGIERDLSVLKAVNRETDGFRGVGALVATAGDIHAGDEVQPLA
ncbi:MAG TPA: MOSC N-terminal beta barrel domain-containing protein [Acidimicrobiales bacterium]|nr:MOSC N-terminal beta barrel domain-containing protein [Acidimicrobiales bacterium]